MVESVNMNNILNKIFSLKMNFNNLGHKYLFLASLISFFAGLFCYVFSALLFPDILTIRLGFWYFVPFILTLAVYFFVGIMLHKYFPGFAKILAFLLNFFIIAILQIFISCGNFFVISILYDDKAYADYNNYPKALSSIRTSSMIKHFPSSLPPNAKNPGLFKSSNGFFGSEEIFLSFESDNEYIQKELKKYKYIKTEGPYENEKQYSNNPIHYLATSKLNLKKTNFKFYTIEDNTTIKSNFETEYGIAINTKTNTILYYYASLD